MRDFLIRRCVGQHENQKSYYDFPNYEFPNYDFSNYDFPNYKFPNYKFPNYEFPNFLRAFVLTSHFGTRFVHYWNIKFHKIICSIPF